MRDWGSGGGGTYVGLAPEPARRLAGLMGASADELTVVGRRIAGLLAEAGPDGTGVATDTVLTGLAGRLREGAADLRWRIEVITADPGARRHGGLLHAHLPFADAAAARRAGVRHGADILAAYQRYVDSYARDATDADREAARSAYLASLHVAGSLAADPAYAGGLVNRLGSEGLRSAMAAALWPLADADDGGRSIVVPLFRALATAAEHGTAARPVSEGMLRWDPRDLAAAMTITRPDTGMLTRVAQKLLVDNSFSDEVIDRPDEAVYLDVLGALSRDDEASFRFLTGRHEHVVNVALFLRPLEMMSDPRIAHASADALRGGLGRFPAGAGSRERNAATESLEHLVEYGARLTRLLDDMHHSLSVVFVDLLRPHVDTVAVIGARAAGVNTHGYDLRVAGRPRERTLDVDPETLERYLGGALQHEESIRALQVLLATYTQRGDHQVNRLPLLDGEVADLDPFLTDSMRIAGLYATAGNALEIAGEDERARTRVLTGAVKLATGTARGKVAGLMPKHPAAWLAQQAVRYAAGEAIEEFEAYVASFEPAGGDEMVDGFLDGYVAATDASLREALAADPELAAMSPAEQEAILRRARVLVENQVGGALRQAYGDLASGGR